MTYQLIRGDAMSLPLADESVDLCVTSPPYFSLRQYTDGGEAYEGQIGSESTPQAFLEALWAVTAECVRVLKPSGSMGVNLGDKYAGGGMGGHGLGLHGPPPQGERNSYRRPTNTGGIPAKSLMGLPWRYAIGCIDELGRVVGGPCWHLWHPLSAERDQSRPDYRAGLARRQRYLDARDDGRPAMRALLDELRQ